MIFIDGKIITDKEAFCPILNRSFLFGDGVYTTILVENGKIYFLEEHIKKVIEGANYLQLATPGFTSADVYEYLKHCDTEGRCSFKIIYAAKTGSERRLVKNRAASLVMIIEKIGPRPEKPLRLGIYPQVVESPISKLKSLAHLSRYFVMEYAHLNGLDDAVTKDSNGNVLECAFANIFWIENGTFHTPCCSLPLFFGLTVTKCIELAKKVNLQIIFEKTSLDKINSPALLFRCNSLGRVCAVEKLGEKHFPVKNEWLNYFNNGLEVGEVINESQLLTI